MRFIPAKDKVLVKPLDPEKKGNLYIPSTSTKEQRKGEIVEVGSTGISVSNGKIIEHPHFYHIGEKIIYQNLDLHEIELNGEKFQVVPLIAILGLLEEEIN